MSFENLYRDDHRVLCQIVVDHAVKDIHCAVITSRSEKRVLRRELNISDCFVMVLHLLVRLLTGEIHVEPKDFFVVSTEDEVVSFRVNADA